METPGGDGGRKAAPGLSLVTALGSMEHSSSLSLVERDPCPSLAWGWAWDLWSLLCLPPMGKGTRHALQAASWPLPGPSRAWNPSLYSLKLLVRSQLHDPSCGMSSLTPESGSGAPSPTIDACITLFLSVLSVPHPSSSGNSGAGSQTAPSPSTQHGM